MIQIDPTLATALDDPHTPWDVLTAILDEVYEHDPGIFQLVTATLKARYRDAEDLLTGHLFTPTSISYEWLRAPSSHPTNKLILEGQIQRETLSPQDYAQILQSQRARTDDLLKIGPVPDLEALKTGYGHAMTNTIPELKNILTQTYERTLLISSSASISDTIIIDKQVPSLKASIFLPAPFQAKRHLCDLYEQAKAHIQNEGGVLDPIRTQPPSPRAHAQRLVFSITIVPNSQYPKALLDLWRERCLYDWLKETAKSHFPHTCYD